MIRADNCGVWPSQVDPAPPILHAAAPGLLLPLVFDMCPGTSLNLATGREDAGRVPLMAVLRLRVGFGEPRRGGLVEYSAPRRAP